MNVIAQKVEPLNGNATTRPPRAAWLSRWRVHLYRLCILVVASYGLLYFTYRFAKPWPGSNDYYANYYFMYLSPLNTDAASAPYNLRQISAVITHLVLATHLFPANRPTAIVPGRDPRVLFAAMVTNWVFLILAAWIAGLIAEQELNEPNALVALVAGFLCLLAFQTPFFVFSGLTEGMNWFLLAAGFLAYMRRARHWLLLILILSIVQRESILIIVGVIAACDLGLSRENKRFKMRVLVEAVACFAIYFLARRLFLPGSSGETHFAEMLAAIRHSGPASTFLSQMVLTQSIAILFFALAWLGRKNRGQKRPWAACLLAAMIVLDLVGVAAGIVDNLGRVLGILVPILAGLAAAQFWRQRHRFE